MNAMVVGALSPEVISLIVRAGSLEAGAPRAIEDAESQAAKINTNRVIGADYIRTTGHRNMSFVKNFCDRWFETKSQKLDGPVMRVFSQLRWHTLSDFFLL